MAFILRKARSILRIFCGEQLQQANKEILKKKNTSGSFLKKINGPDAFPSFSPA